MRGLVRRVAALPDLRRFSRDALLLLVALTAFNGSNYVFHVVVSRLLGPSDYGGLAALLAVMLVLSVPSGVLHTVIAQRVAALRARGQGDEAIAGLAAETMKTLAPIAWLGAALYAVVAAPLLAHFLHLDLLSSVLVAPYVALIVLASVPLGVLQGELKFGSIAIVLVAAAVFRLAVGIALVAGGLGVTGAVIATSVSPAVTLLLGLRLGGFKRAARRAARRSFAHFRGQFATALLGLTSFWLLAQIDIALARHFLDHEEAGFYSSSGLLARTLLFLPAAVAIVAFPHFVRAREQGRGHARWLWASLAVVTALVGAALPFLIVLREPLVAIAFGDAYRPGAALLPALTIAMALLAIVNLLTYFHVAMGSRLHLATFAAVGVEAVLVVLFHGSGEQIAIVVACVSGALALVHLQTARSLVRWRPALERAEAPEVAMLARRPTLELSIVLPCHNVGPGVRSLVRSLRAHLGDVGSHEIIVVSDGSTDDTAAVVAQLADEGVRLREYPTRRGKGYALHVGLNDARGEYVAFLDGDGDIGPEAIRSFLALMKLYQPDVVLGSKRHPLSEVYYPPLRRALSWGYHKLARLLFRVNVRDTQTGVKLIRRDVLAAVLPRLLEKRYAFDLEFLVVARSLGYKRVFEAPVSIQYRFASQVAPASVFRILLDTLAIFYRHHLLNTYRSAGRGAEALPEQFAPGAPLPSGEPGGARRRARTRARGDRLRILLLNWRDIRNPASGGAEIFAHEIARRWVDRGHEVSLLTSRFPGAVATETIDDIRIRRVGRLRSGSFHALVQRELARLGGFDLVVDGVNTIPFLTPLWRRRLPPAVALVYQLAGEIWDVELPRPLAATGRWLEPRLLRPYRGFPTVAISESTRAELLALGIDDVAVVPPGRDEPPDVSGIAKNGRPTFLFAGRLAANKRPDHAVEAFRHIRRAVPGAVLWIAGRGPLEQKLSSSLPEGAELLGYVERDELYRRMAAAHCLLVPSVREGWGMVVVEANSVGTPAAGYDVPGIRDSIRNDSTGVLAPPGDPAALADRALALVRDATAYDATRAAALAWAQEFSWERAATELLEFACSRLPELADAGAAPADEPRAAPVPVGTPSQAEG